MHRGPDFWIECKYLFLLPPLKNLQKHIDHRDYDNDSLFSVWVFVVSNSGSNWPIAMVQNCIITFWHHKIFKNIHLLPINILENSPSVMCFFKTVQILFDRTRKWSSRVPCKWDKAGQRLYHGQSQCEFYFYFMCMLCCHNIYDNFDKQNKWQWESYSGWFFIHY